MSTELVGLAVLMWVATYPSRALGLLTPGLDRLPRPALDYLQLVGPAVLTALAAVTVMVVVGTTGERASTSGSSGSPSLVALGITAWRRNLLLGLIAAVLITVVAREMGLGTIPGL